MDIDINFWLRLAAKLSLQLHDGQVDKTGEPYFLHPMRVACSLYPNKQAMIVAFMHDLIEDGKIELSYLLECGFDKETVLSIDALTHRDNETYADYVSRACQDKIGILVKYQDILDNIRSERLSLLDFGTQKRLIVKYSLALEIIREHQIRSGMTESLELVQNLIYLANLKNSLPICPDNLKKSDSADKSNDRNNLDTLSIWNC